MEKSPDIIDSSGNENHGWTRNPDHIKKNQPPILGGGKSYHLRPPGYLELGGFGDSGNLMNAGFYLGFDIQPEGAEELAVCGTENKNGSALLIRYNVSGAQRRLQVDVRDEEGKSLSAYAQLSDSAGKRVFVSVDPSENAIVIAEINLYRGEFRRDIIYVAQERPTNFNAFKHPIIYGGYNFGGQKHGTFRGRVSQTFFVPNEVLTNSKLEQFTEVSWSDIEGIYGQRQKLPASLERRNCFEDDLEKLQRWTTQRRLSRTQMRDASVILYRWLFDRHPILQDLCDELGIQLSFPGVSERGKVYHAAIEKSKPAYAQSFQIGRKSMFGFQWVPLKEFGYERAFIIEGHLISHEAFVKFVRNKLGGGHFDAVDRKKWQKDLAKDLAILEAYKGRISALHHHMKQIVGAVLDTVDACGISRQVAYDSSLRWTKDTGA